MDVTDLRRRIAHLLSEARVTAVQLSEETGDDALLYFIEMSILEFLAQQEDAMEEAGTLVADEDGAYVGKYTQ